MSHWTYGEMRRIKEEDRRFLRNVAISIVLLLFVLPLIFVGLRALFSQ